MLLMVMLLVSGNGFAKSKKSDDGIQLRITSSTWIKDFFLKNEGGDLYSYEMDGKKLFITKYEIINGMKQNANFIKKSVKTLTIPSLVLSPITLIGIYTLKNSMFFTSMALTTHTTLGFYAGGFALAHYFYKKKIKSFKNGITNNSVIAIDKNIMKGVNPTFYNLLIPESDK